MLLPSVSRWTSVVDAMASLKRFPRSFCKNRSTRRIFCSEKPLRRNSAITEISTTSGGVYTRLWPSCRGDTTLRSSHHCNWRRLTPQIRATSLLLNPCASEEDAGRDFLPLNISRHFRSVNLPPPWIVDGLPAVSMGGG